MQVFRDRDSLQILKDAAGPRQVLEILKQLLGNFLIIENLSGRRESNGNQNSCCLRRWYIYNNCGYRQDYRNFKKGGIKHRVTPAKITEVRNINDADIIVVTGKTQKRTGMVSRNDRYAPIYRNREEEFTKDFLQKVRKYQVKFITNMDGIDKMIESIQRIIDLLGPTILVPVVVFILFYSFGSRPEKRLPVPCLWG